MGPITSMEIAEKLKTYNEFVDPNSIPTKVLKTYSNY